MSKDVVKVLAGIMELGCLAGLTGIALKRNNDCYKAQCELVDEQFKRINAELANALNESKASRLEKELEDLKAQLAES